jgi:hypothetical protein
MTADGLGGGLLSWEHNGDVYMQRLNPDGTIATGWGTDGNVVCNNPSAQSHFAMTYDGTHGGIVAWQDQRTGVGINALFVGGLNGTGGAPSGWTANGTRLISATAIDEHEQVIVPDIDGGAVVVFSRELTSGNPASYDIYAQRIDSAGDVGSVASVPIGSRTGQELTAWPSPMRGGTLNIAFTSVAQEPASVELFDVRGRCVHRLLSPTSLGVGQQVVKCTLTDATAEPLGSGLYWVRLRQGDKVSSTPIVVLR